MHERASHNERVIERGACTPFPSFIFDSCTNRYDYNWGKYPCLVDLVLSRANFIFAYRELFFEYDWHLLSRSLGAFLIIVVCRIWQQNQQFYFFAPKKLINLFLYAYAYQ